MPSDISRTSDDLRERFKAALLKELGGREDRLDAGGGVQSLGGKVIGRVGARTRDGNAVGLRLGRGNQLPVGLEGRFVSDDDGVRRVVIEVDVGNVLRLVLHGAFQRLQHDMRKVGAHQRIAIAGEGIDLRPRQRAAGVARGARGEERLEDVADAMASSIGGK